MATDARAPTPIVQADPLLQEVVSRLRAAYQPDRIYLFGAHARNEQGPDSDYDILVVVPDDAPIDRRESRLAYQVLWGLRVSADVLVWRRTAFDSRLHLAASLPSTVLREGILLHAA